MKNWKKVMAMLCTAAMITGFSAPVWAEADAAEETEAAEATEITELTIDMLEEAAYEGTWLTFEPGFDLYVPSNWNVLEVSEEDQADGVMFQALDPESEDGVNLAVTVTEVGTEYDLDSMAQELDEAGYIDVEKVSINGIFAVSFETESTYGIGFLDDTGIMYNVQIGPKSEELQPTAETLFISLIKSEENTYKDDAQAADETADEAADEEAAN